MVDVYRIRENAYLFGMYSIMRLRIIGCVVWGYRGGAIRWGSVLACFYKSLYM